MKARIFTILNLIVFACFSSYVNAQWQKSGTYSGQVNCLAVYGNNIFSGTEEHGVFLSTDNGASWAEINTGLPCNGTTCYAVYSIITDGTNVFAGFCCGNGVYRSTNNGTNWAAANNGLVLNNTYSMAICGTTVLAATQSGIYKTTNNGANWSGSSSGLTSNMIFDLVTKGTDVYAGTVGVCKSINYGASWTVSNSFSGNFVRAVAASSTDVFAGVSTGKAHKSSNNGATWTQIYNGTNVIRDIATSNDSNIFLASDGTGGDKVFMSTNTGASWLAINDGLPNTDINALAINGTTIYAGTNVGVYKRELSEVTGIIESLNNNKTSIYPTPANDKIFIETQGYKNAVIEILNIEGQLLQCHKLLNFQTELNISDLPCGIYIVTVKNDKDTITKKIIKQ